MDSSSVDAYDLPERVRTYDADMDIMHPLRWKMIEVALEVLPFHQARSLKALDLGVGTGGFSKQFLEKYPNSTIVAVDGAASMLELAKSRLGELGKRVKWIQSDFQTMPASITKLNTFDVVISSYALHHLNALEKPAVLKSVIQAIKPAGWFLNADIIMAESANMEQRIREIRIEAITGRAPKQDKRFNSTAATRQVISELEAAEKDRPQTLDNDMRILRESGITNVEVFWKEYRETLIGGTRSNTV